MKIVIIGAIILIAIIALLSCDEPAAATIKGDEPTREEVIMKFSTAKFHRGDIVYIKPDSIKAIIINYYYDKEGYYYGVCNGPTDAEYGVYEEMIY